MLVLQKPEAKEAREKRIALELEDRKKVSLALYQSSSISRLLFFTLSLSLSLNLSLSHTHTHTHNPHPKAEPKTRTPKPEARNPKFETRNQATLKMEAERAAKKKAHEVFLT